jgi:hypothetical protein
MALNAEIVSGLYRWLSCEASIKLIGTDLERIRKQHSKLSSPVIKQKRSKGKCCKRQLTISSSGSQKAAPAKERRYAQIKGE